MPDLPRRRIVDGAACVQPVLSFDAGRRRPGRLAVGMLVGLSLLSGSTAARSSSGRAPERQRPSRPPDIYFVPTSHAVADAMLRLAGVTADDVVYDLGSGDGRIVILAAQKFGARGVGVELDPRLVAISREVAREGAVADKVAFIEGDLFTADISEATVVTLYLSPNVNRKLEGKLKRELRPGTRVVSHQFPIAGWTPIQRETTGDGTELFLWTIPPRPSHEP